MNIIHYSLGLPPLRSGGMTRYATDLMLKQVESGHSVSLIYPTSQLIRRNKVQTIESKGTFSGIKIYSLSNGIPVPLFYGINAPNDFMDVDIEVPDNSLQAFGKVAKPDIIHIHTLMGLTQSFISFSKVIGAKSIFTTHDYFGLCPRVNFINYQKKICESPTGDNCSKCNINAPNNTFLRIRNSDFVLRNKTLFSLLLEFKKLVTNKSKTHKFTPAAASSANYIRLLDHYNKLLKMMDLLHYNSSVAKDVYDKHFGDSQNHIIQPVSHNGIIDNRKRRSFDPKNIKFGFIGSTEDYKGYPILKAAFESLSNVDINNWTLSVWGSNIITTNSHPSIHARGTFKHFEQDQVYSDIDVLIVPSIWKETFSLVALEALSYGIPVLVTTNVGAKDIIQHYDPDFILQPTEIHLAQAIRKILKDPSIIDTFNRRICEGDFLWSLSRHESIISNAYASLLDKPK